MKKTYQIGEIKPWRLTKESGYRFAKAVLETGANIVSSYWDQTIPHEHWNVRFKIEEKDKQTFIENIGFPIFEVESIGGSETCGEKKFVRSQRRVVASAMKMADGKIVTGVRHFSPDMRETLYAIYGEGYHKLVVAQGFIDKFGKFMDRSEAYIIAKDAGQLIGHNPAWGEILYSESVW